MVVVLELHLNFRSLLRGTKDQEGCSFDQKSSKYGMKSVHACSPCSPCKHIRLIRSLAGLSLPPEEPQIYYTLLCSYDSSSSCGVNARRPTPIYVSTHTSYSTNTAVQYQVPDITALTPW